MRSIAILLAFRFVAGASESARDIRPLGIQALERIYEVKEQILIGLIAVTLEGFSSDAVFQRKVEIANTVQSGFVEIASFVEDAKSAAYATNAIEALQEKMEEKFVEMDKLLPAGNDARTLARKFLNQIVTAGKAKLDELIMQKKTAQQGDPEIDSQIMTLAEEILRAPVIAGHLGAHYDYGLPADMREVLLFVDKFIAANYQQVRDTESIFSRFNIVGNFVNEFGIFSDAYLYKKSLWISSASAVKRNLLAIANSDSVGQIAVRIFALSYVDLFSSVPDGLDEGEMESWEKYKIRRYEQKWFAAVLEKFIDSYADGYLDTFLKLSEVVKVARNELAGDVKDQKKHDKILRGLIPQIGKLLLKFDEAEKESKNNEEEEEEEEEEEDE